MKMRRRDWSCRWGGKSEVSYLLAGTLANTAEKNQAFEQKMGNGLSI